MPPQKLGRPFTHWSVRKLAAYLADNPVRTVAIGRERLREILAGHDITFQKTRTWKESNDLDKEAELDRIEEVTSSHPDRWVDSVPALINHDLSAAGLARVDDLRSIPRQPRDATPCRSRVVPQARGSRHVSE